MKTMEHTKWSLDPAHSTLGFKVKHLMITNVSGSFQIFDASVETDGTDFTAVAIRLRAQIGSIDTNNARRDAHLRSSDFFEAEKFPELIFQSTRVESGRGKLLRVRKPYYERCYKGGKIKCRVQWRNKRSLGRRKGRFCNFG